MIKVMKGIAGSGGIGIGTVLWYRTPSLGCEDICDNTPERELERYREAVEDFTESIQEKADHVEMTVGVNEAEILRGQEAMVKDPVFSEQVEQRIAQGHSGENALSQVCQSFIDLFSQSDDELFRQRADDVRDIRLSLVSLLSGQPKEDFSRIGGDTVVIAGELTPSVMTELQQAGVAGILLLRGGVSSHCAILARAMGIPMVVSLGDDGEELQDGHTVIVDGEEGLALLGPREEELNRYRKKTMLLRGEEIFLVQYATRQTVLSNGQKCTLYSNAGSEKDVLLARESGAEGIGLFRSEFYYLQQKALPSEEEEYKSYCQIIRQLEGRPITIRLLDVGADKQLPYLQVPEEDNPALGLRGIRLTLYFQEILRSQLRAILRAAKEGTVRIMIPMVTNLREVREVKALIAQAREELEAQGIHTPQQVPLGVMIETAGAVFAAEELADEVDFFSIGTNDLTQYIMCADRENTAVSSLCSYYYPAVIRAIKLAAHTAQRLRVPVSVCGESASDLAFLPVLLGFGITSFSVSPRAVTKVRRCLSLWNQEEANYLAKEILSLPTQQEIKARLEQVKRT